ncbi:MAG: heparan-alpha-glucosaminide N-acetyltransferase domain-containing protein [Ferruginibacter sp.]
MPTIKKNRIQSIDLLRGIIMVIMALDHTRDFFHVAAFSDDPLNLATTTPFLYFTRWITNFCAPGFVFLAGTSAWLQSRRKTTAELSRFLITRGCWLILIDLTVMTLGILGDIHFGIFVLQTIWAIGISMVILGLVIWLPFSAILTLGLLIVFGHNVLDFVEKIHIGPYPLWWSMLHVRSLHPLWGNHQLFVVYPFLSWAGLMMLGYCCGKIFTQFDEAKRNKILLWTGIGLVAFFIALRATNFYGNPQQWSQQKNGLYTLLSFLDVQKYPPSLLYMCITIGPSLVFLALIKNSQSRLSKIFMVYGRVPFFYYIIHFYVLHIISIICFLSRGHSFADGMKGLPGVPFKFIIPGEGYSLWVVYGVWISVVIALYPLCKWYDQYKSNHPEKKWLSYL